MESSLYIYRLAAYVKYALHQCEDKTMSATNSACAGGKVPWAYFREFGVAMTLYVVVIVSSVSVRGSIDSRPLAIAVEMAPVIPLGLAFWAIMRQYGRFDELMKRIQSEAFALGAILTGFGYMIYGFAENAGAPALPNIWVGVSLLAAWGLCLPVVMRRYR